MASPSDYDLAIAAKNNIVGSTPFTRRDVRIITALHSRDAAALKGETTKKPRKIPNTDEVSDIPSYIVKNYSEVNLYVDVIPLNSIMFLVGASKRIGLVQYVCVRKKYQEKFLEAILIMIREYRAQEVFDFIGIGANEAFKSIKSELEDKPYQVALTTCDANRYVEVIERMIRFVKERI